MNHTIKLGFLLRDLPPISLYPSTLHLRLFSPTGPLLLPTVNTEKIHQAPHSLNICKPAGPDGIPLIVLKMCSWFNSSFTSHLPFFQTSYLSRLLELRSDPSDSNNYRPISHICHLENTSNCYLRPAAFYFFSA